MLGHCSTADRKGSDDAFDGTEELESTRRDDSVRSSSTFSVQSCCWKTAVHHQSETGSDVSDKMLVIQICVTDLTRAKKALRYFKGTRELNLYLTIPALKLNDLSNTLKHVTGYSDADWDGDPVTRKSTSCTLCYVDQFFLTRGCRGRGTVALSSGESERCALGALSAELIFAQAILKEIGLSFLIHARADSSTARAVATKHGASRKMKHIHTRLLFIQDLVFRKLLTMSSVKTDVNPSDIGTKALGRERFYRLRSMLGMGTDLTETSSLGNWHDGNERQRRVASRTYGEVDESNDRHM